MSAQLKGSRVPGCCSARTSAAWLFVLLASIGGAQTDHGVRSGEAGAGDALPGLTFTQKLFFLQGKDAFQEVDFVQNPPPNGGEGLGPRFNMDSCAGCHATPAGGGSSPATNPQVQVATKLGARNAIPPFITLTGPVREVRFVRKPDGSPDGGVHDLFVINGRTDARRLQHSARTLLQYRESLFPNSDSSVRSGSD